MTVLSTGFLILARKPSRKENLHGTAKPERVLPSRPSSEGPRPLLSLTLITTWSGNSQHFAKPQGETRHLDGFIFTFMIGVIMNTLQFINPLLNFLLINFALFSLWGLDFLLIWRSALNNLLTVSVIIFLRSVTGLPLCLWCFFHT